MPTSDPAIETRAEQPYVGIKRAVTMQTVGHGADRIPAVFEWLAQRGIEPAGAPFLKFDVIDMEGELVIQAGVPIAAPVAAGAEGEGDDEVFCSVLPAGRYATATHLGAFDELIDATRALLEWAAASGLVWDSIETDAGTSWGCRLEIYHTNPALEPDPAKYRTQLAFRLADNG